MPVTKRATKTTASKKVTKTAAKTRKVTKKKEDTENPLKAPFFDALGERDGEVDLPKAVFDEKPNMPVMHQAYLRQLANARQGTASTKTRGNVAGGGAKPYRQKGTGRARHGSIREPSMKGGGTVFGPHTRAATSSGCRSRCAGSPCAQHSARKRSTGRFESSRASSSMSQRPSRRPT